MISQERLQKLKILFEKDGIVMNDEGLLEIGSWLVERAKSTVGYTGGKATNFRRTAIETKMARALQKMSIL